MCMEKKGNNSVKIRNDTKDAKKVRKLLIITNN